MKISNGIATLIGENTYDITVNPGTKYFDKVFDQFPFGIINKTETGVGATTMELSEKRNSIIVEPLRITASLKQGKTPGSLYVGSPIKKSQVKVTGSDIVDYLKGPENVGGYKKIICTTDSLPRLLDAIPLEMKDDFFLLIDESDTVQQDSNFRESMNEAMEIYKTFDPNKRALLTATPIEFTDPDLKSERRLNINWSIKTTTKIVHIETDNLYGMVAELVLDLYEKSKQLETSGKEFEPIVVSVNHVSNLILLAEFLIEKGIKKEEISILCGQGSKTKAGEFWATMDSDKLPNRIVLKTSAYYTGFDINQDYHLILVSDNKDPLNSPSIGRIRQIMGRCRSKLLSCKLIQEFSEAEKEQEFTTEDLVEKAMGYLRLAECWKNHIQKGEIFDKNVENIFKNLVENLEINGYPLLQMKFDGENIDLSVNYLGIDGILELQKTRKHLYSNTEQLREELDKLELLEFSNKINSKTNITDCGSPKFPTVQAMVENVLSELRANYSSIDEIEKNYSNSTVELIFNILKNYGKSYDPDQLLDLIEDYYFKKGKAKGLCRLENQLCFYHQSSDSTYKKTLNEFFPEGSTFTEEEVMGKLSIIKKSMNLGGLFQKNDLTGNWLSLLVESKRTPNMGSKKKRHTAFKIISHNPLV